MKLHTSQNTIEKSSSFQTSNYKIDATAKAFAILSDSLYSNKVKAVVREISTNAYDAHVAAGCPDKPFYVQIPTKLDTTFAVRDYGTGLSHDDCFDLYTTYFRSDKTDSNDAVGCLGLGSKSPFAYTDQFLVESFYNGTHYTFSSYKGDTGEPVFSLLDEKPTDEPNGMRISMSVDPEDSGEFREEAETIYETFDVRPTTSVPLNFQNNEVLVEGSNWKIYKSGWKNTVIMGQVSYPIDTDQFEYGTDAYKLLDGCNGFEIKVDIGDLDITPSRESLSYNDRTKKNILSIVTDALSELSDIVKDSVAECETIWDARLKFISMFKKLDRIASVSTSLNSIGDWNGIELFDGEVLGYSKFSVDTGIETLVEFQKSQWRESISRKETQHVFLGDAKGVSIIYQDSKRGAVGRVRHFLLEKGQGYAYLIRTEEELNTFIENSGCPRELVINSSGLPAPPKKASSSSSYYSGATSPAIRILKHEGDSVSSSKWVSKETKVSVKEEDAFYLTKIRDSVCVSSIYNDYSFHIDSVKYLLQSLEDAGYDVGELDNKIFIVTPSTAKSMKLEGRENWTDGVTYLKEAVLEALRMNRQNFITMESSLFGMWSVGNGGSMNTHKMIGISGKTTTENAFSDFYETYKVPELPNGVTCESLKTLRRMAKSLRVWTDFDESISSQVVDTDEMYDIMIKEYPMISLLGHPSEDDYETIANYIDRMEN